MENHVSTTICVPLSGSNHTVYLITVNAVNVVGSGVNTSDTCTPSKTRLTVYNNLPRSKRYAIVIHACRDIMSFCMHSSSKADLFIKLCTIIKYALCCKKHQAILYTTKVVKYSSYHQIHKLTEFYASYMLK